MWSRSRSAFEPSSLTTAPLTVTRPSRMICSACRREAMPACDRIFCRRSSAIARLVVLQVRGLRGRRLRGCPLVCGLRFSRRFCGCGPIHRFRFGYSLRLSRRLGPGRRFVRERHPADLLELLERRQLAQILQPELDQELFRGLVQHRLADDVLPPRHRDQLAVEQRLQHARALNAADFLDFRPGHRLLIGDHRQRLERRSESFSGGFRLLTKLRTASWCSGLVAILKPPATSRMVTPCSGRSNSAISWSSSPRMRSAGCCRDAASCASVSGSSATYTMASSTALSCVSSAESDGCSATGGSGKISSTATAGCSAPPAGAAACSAAGGSGFASSIATAGSSASPAEAAA